MHRPIRSVLMLLQCVRSLTTFPAHAYAKELTAAVDAVRRAARITTKLQRDLAKLMRWCNLKRAFAGHRGQKRQPAGMAEMLDALGLPLEGHHHSGIDDCRNLAKVVRSLLAQGWKVAPTGQRAASAGCLT